MPKILSHKDKASNGRSSAFEAWGAETNDLGQILISDRFLPTNDGKRAPQIYFILKRASEESTPFLCRNRSSYYKPVSIGRPPKAGYLLFR
ncbi:hypothetical protein A2V54_02775 [candidate division WWE3 bacterium RBG_19FT_COMBO_53_11]|uniref:Uncharacterized protein n=1 Tax=candidate division WWE3 bacterium RBG_19FT_COMBO_53_11 TaxID=1802613 RepID=A0A1F4UJ60_UNCKA|nr:MAG: hypothetical protein A2V54_02775 [candidate division WWE3 bacterium RBG_19FT_COMBO_53_11]